MVFIATGINYFFVIYNTLKKIFLKGIAMKDDYANITMKIRNQFVTGSQIRFVVKSSGSTSTMLVDNGAFQDKEGNEFPKEDFSDVSAVWLTHGHIDHSGGLANMAKQVYIPVYATAPTTRLIIPMLNDMYNVMSMHGCEVTREDTLALNKLKVMLKEVKLYSKIKCENCEATFIDNAHILGASMVYVRATDKYRPINFLFSGDYREEHPFIRTHGVGSFLKKNPVDVLVLESTYGNKENHIPFSDSVSNLEEILEEGLEKGSVLLASFSIDRTPVLLYMINQIQKENPKLESIPVYLDGVLATKALQIYKEYESKFKCCWADIIPQNFEIVADKDYRKALQSDPKPKIIISTSGNLHGGSIVSWVSKMLPDANSTIVQSGYVAHPIGKKIFEIEQGGTVDYFGQSLEVNATRKVLTGTSAHADKNGLMRLVERCLKVNPKLKVVLTHGDIEAKKELRIFLSNIMNIEDIYIQSSDQHFEINKHTLASGNILVDDEV